MRAEFYNPKDYITEKDTYNPNCLVECPFPLRPDLLVHFKVPMNITLDEVARIEKFLMSLVKVEEG